MSEQNQNENIENDENVENVIDGSIKALTLENYQKGFLIDHEWLAGVADDPDSPGKFVAFVVNHTTGEALGAHQYDLLDEALQSINKIEREWVYAKASGCGGGQCGEEGCGGGGCHDHHEDHDHDHDHGHGHHHGEGCC